MKTFYTQKHTTFIPLNNMSNNNKNILYQKLYIKNNNII